MEPLNSKSCRQAQMALQDTLSVVNGKWKLILLSILLREGPHRFKELSREAGISPRILSKELKDLEGHQLVSRTVCDTRPITVEYAATDYAKTLQAVIAAMADWGRQHRERIMGKKEFLEVVE